jgi:hypothetical protein
MTTLNTITLEPSHAMASSNTGNPMVFRNTVGNYISRKAYLEMLATISRCSISSLPIT